MLYNKLCPPNRQLDAFYLRPLRKFSVDRWYCASPVGINTLGTVVQRICKMAGFVGHYTNHSLRSTAATRLFNANVEEQLVMEKTGHVSTAVRAYKRVSEDQQQQLSDILVSKTLKMEPTIASSAKSDTGDGGVSETASKSAVIININVHKY